MAHAILFDNKVIPMYFLYRADARESRTGIVLDGPVEK